MGGSTDWSDGVLEFWSVGLSAPTTPLLQRSNFFSDCSFGAQTRDRRGIQPQSAENLFGLLA